MTSQITTNWRQGDVANNRGLSQNTLWIVYKPLFYAFLEVMVEFLVVLIGLVLIFKKQLTTLVNDIFKTITSESKKV